jgi:flagellar hook-associated protein 3 FlgL
MTRVSENSSSHALAFALNKAKSKMENLQIKGSTLQNITRPSDNPLANVEAMSIASNTSDNKQYLRNIDYAQVQLNTTETSLEQLTEIMSKAKEIAIAQSSDFYGDDVRANVSQEIEQLRNQALSVGNKRLGNRYIFGGFSTLKSPFDGAGTYQGDRGRITLEVAKDFFIPVNITGEEVFYSEKTASSNTENPLEQFEELNKSNNIPELADKGQGEEDLEVNGGVERKIASTEEHDFQKRNNIFGQLELLMVGLENNDSTLIQSLLEGFDDTIGRLITLRTKVGSVSSNVISSRGSLESNNLENETRKSLLVDADISELYTDITTQQALLKTTYQSSQGMMNQTLLDFLR